MILECFILKPSNINHFFYFIDYLFLLIEYNGQNNHVAPWDCFLLLIINTNFGYVMDNSARNLHENKFRSHLFVDLRW